MTTSMRQHFDRFLDDIEEEGWRREIRMPDGTFEAWPQPFFGNYTVVFTPTRMKPPFNRQMRMSAYGVKFDAEGVDQVLRSMSHLSRRPELVAELDAQERRLQTLISGSGVELVNFVPIGVIDQKGTLELMCRTTMLGINDGLVRARREDTVSSWGSMDDSWAAIRRYVLTQKSRLAAMDRGLTARGLVTRRLEAMAAAERSRLLAFIALNPGPTAEDNDDRVRAHWTAAELRRRGLSLPDGAETMRVKEGEVIARIRLSDEASWNHDSVVVRAAALPDSIAIGLEGRPIGDVVDHPEIAGLGAVDGIRHDRGRLRIRVAEQPRPLG